MFQNFLFGKYVRAIIFVANGVRFSFMFWGLSWVAVAILAKWFVVGTIIYAKHLLTRVS